MKNKLKKIIISVAAALFLCFCLSSSVFAEETQTQPQDETETDRLINEQLNALGADQLLDSLPEETQDLLSQLGIDHVDYSKLLEVSPGGAFRLMGAMLGGSLKTPLAACAAIIGLILLCAVLQNFKPNFGGGMDGVFGLIVSFCALTAVIVPVAGVISDAASAIELGGSFMLSFVPVLAAVIALSGSPATALGYNTVVFSAAQFMSWAANSLIMPLVFVFLGLSAASSFSTAVDLKSITSGLKKAVTVVLGFFSTVFVGLIMTKSIVAGAADSVTNRGIKFFSSSFIPVIGSAIGEAITTLRGCMGLVRGTLGSFGILAYALIYLPIILEVCAWLFALWVCVTCAEMFGLSNVSGILKAVQSTLSLLLTILIFFTLLMIVTTTVVLVIKSGGAG